MKGNGIKARGKNRFRETHSGEVMPREQFMRAEDPRGVPDETLVAILLRTGTRGCDVLELARRLIEAFGSLKALVSSDWRGILERVKECNRARPERKITGFGKVKCLELAAAFELGRRRQRLAPGDLRERRIADAEAAHVLFRPCLTVDDEQENAWVLALDADRRAVCEPFLVSRGTADSTLMHPREVFKQALRWGAHSIYVAHNHPSGNPNPGPKDFERTRELAQVAGIVGIVFRDHLVLGDQTANDGMGFVSIRAIRPELFRS
ncbi:MAG: DNA repair protein RadC [Kiritimatiellae bacterium]|nr:DNA repair protein RadC [Kiritimatiellia bacterium]